MAINIQTGKSNTKDSVLDGEFAFFDRSSKIKKSNKFLFNGSYIIIPGEGIFEPKFYNGKFDLHQRVYALSTNNSKILIKYLFYFIFKNKNNFYKYAVGSTVPSLRLSSFDWIKKHNFPILNIQQKIIDIIEPFEFIENSLKLLKLKIFFILKNLDYEDFKLMKLNVFFEKGKTIKSSNFNNGNNNIPFIDIKCLKSGPSKYLCSKLYVFNSYFGDVLLALDGSPGRISIFQEGYNGYAYNLKPKKETTKAIIFSSLLNKRNQNIIKIHSHGTTIKHAVRAKEYLELLNFKNKKLIEYFYKLLLIIEKIRIHIKNLKQKSQKLLLTNILIS